MAALSLSDRAFDAVEACGFRYDAAKLYVQQRAANYTAVEHVVCAAYVSALVGALEAWLSYIAGAADASDGILAVSIMAVAEILGSVFVLYRWKLTAGVDRYTSTLTPAIPTARQSTLASVTLRAFGAAASSSRELCRCL